MRFATRTFLWSFLPFAVLLLGSFWAIQTLVVSTVRSELRSSLRATQVSMARVHTKSELHNSRFLRMVGESAALKAGLQLLLADPENESARLTVEDQLREICVSLQFDFLVVATVDNQPLAGIIRARDSLVAMALEGLNLPRRGFVTLEGNTFQVTSVPIDQGDEQIGVLSVGERFDFTEFTTPAVLTRHGKLIQSSIPVPAAELETALRSCPDRAECEVKLGSESYLSLPMESIYFGDGYLLRSLQSIDRSGRPVQAILRNVFLVAGLGALAAALILSVFSSRTIVRPLAGVVAYLRESEKTGILPEFQAAEDQVLEIRELTESFNHAALAIREARNNLNRANVEFIGSLANALDARDCSTAGHSRRVSDLSCALAQAMNISGQELEDIRMGALLHDIGKIGIADAVLQKPGRLTAEEFAVIQQHPTIGRRILEGVNGFWSYLPMVELHHENWDGSGYPKGLHAETTPLCARIVHVADAYDAMTSDRPYRRGMSHEQAIRLIAEEAGRQFDPAIVETLLKLDGLAPGVRSIHNLAQAVRSQNGPLVNHEARSNAP